MESGTFWDTELAVQIDESTNPPGPPSSSAVPCDRGVYLSEDNSNPDFRGFSIPSSEEVHLEDNVIHAKPLPPTPPLRHSTPRPQKYVLREAGFAMRTSIICGIFIVFDGQKYNFRAVGKYRSADYVGHVSDIMYWNTGYDLYILHGGVMTKHRIPKEVNSYKICLFRGKVRFLFAYDDYATLAIDCRYMGIKTIPDDKDRIYYFDGNGVVPADYIGENSTLVFFGRKLRFPLKVGNVKKRHLIIRENSIIWRKRCYNTA